MSAVSQTKRLMITDLAAMKNKTPIVCLTAYAANMARLLDAHIDCFIVGDSLGMVLYGHASTLGVSVDTMMEHGKTVVQHSHRACVVVDLPFGSYQSSPEQAFETASAILAYTGCQAIKLEGGMEMVDTVAFLTARGIPVMAHIGLKPQHLNQMGGYKYQGRSDAAAALLMDEALAFEKAGAFGLLLEGIKESVASDITLRVAIPTIGIGASVACDGQVLVTDDMIGLTQSAPKFARRYLNMAELIDKAVSDYACDVRNRAFPTLDHTFGTKPS